MSDMHQYSHDAFSASPNFTDTLFSEHEQKALQSFLDGLEQDDQNFTNAQDVQMNFQVFNQDIPPSTYTNQLAHHPHPFHVSPQRSNTYPQTQVINIPRTHSSQNSNPIMLSSPQSLSSSFSLPQHFTGSVSSSVDAIKSNGSPTPTDKRRRASVIVETSSSGLPAKNKRKTSGSSGGSPKSETPQIPPRRPGRRKGTTNAISNVPVSQKNALSPPQTDAPLSDSPEPKSSARGKKPPHELLTEEEKKANHIASEQKRRANIRVGFDQLVELVPTLSACHRSEALILQKSVEYIEQLIAAKNDLKGRVRDLTDALGENSNMEEDSSEGELDMATY